MRVAIALLLVGSFSSCKDWLTEPTPGQTTVNDYYTAWQSALENVNAAYVPLAWEFQDTYYCEWFIGDIVSDDALKGGQYVQQDMADAYDMENWKTQTDNGLILQYYRAKYQGIQRCNLVLERVAEMDSELFTAEGCPRGLQERILGEAYFLRAFYYFQLVRVFGGVPLVAKTLTDQSEWQQPRATVEQVYASIIADLKEANSRLWRLDDTRFDEDTDLGRATKGAAQAMLLKVNLYAADNGLSCGTYADARAWGDSIIKSNVYALETEYADNWKLQNENGIESVFEIQYTAEATSDYGEGNGFSRGTFTQILTRSRSETLLGSNTGWGFNKPTRNLYNEYEANDPRRDATILDVPESMMSTPSVENYQDATPYCSKKYAIYTGDIASGTLSCYTLDHATRGPLNYKLIRYADVLLMYAEACEGAGGAGEMMGSTDALNMVRNRVGMPTYPGYSFSVNGVEIASPTIIQAIRHERRVELAMEGHRWFDICRWGGFDGNGVKAHMDAYKATENAEVQAEMAEFIAGKHELFPIPIEEIQMNPMDQNPGYQGLGSGVYGAASPHTMTHNPYSVNRIFL